MFWGAKKNLELNRIEKLHKMAFNLFFFLKKFEKVEKTRFFRAKFFLQCKYSIPYTRHPIIFIPFEIHNWKLEKTFSFIGKSCETEV